MNGSNNLEEFDKKPLEMCPVCIRKLQYNMEFDMHDRYKKLKDLYSKLSPRFKPTVDCLKGIITDIDIVMDKLQKSISTTNRISKK